MKRSSRIAILIVFLCVLVLSAKPIPAQASNQVETAVAAGEWSTGTEVEIDLEADPAPYDWYQLLARGVKISAPGEICHEFRGGQFKWKADIRQLVKGKWVKVPTTQGWQPSEEGLYMACAQAPAAGTYALFGYYTGPKEYFDTAPSLPACQGMDIEGHWYAGTHDGKLILSFMLESVPASLVGSTLTYEILSYAPTSTTLASLTGTFDYRFEMYRTEIVRVGDVDSLTFRLFTPTCYLDITPTEAK